MELWLSPVLLHREITRLTPLPRPGLRSPASLQASQPTARLSQQLWKLDCVRAAYWTGSGIEKHLDLSCNTKPHKH